MYMYIVHSILCVFQSYFYPTLFVSYSTVGDKLHTPTHPIVYRQLELMLNILGLRQVPVVYRRQAVYPYTTCPLYIVLQEALNAYTLFVPYIAIGDKLRTPTLFVPYIQVYSTGKDTQAVYFCTCPS